MHHASCFGEVSWKSIQLWAMTSGWRGGEGGLPHQASQGEQVGPGIGQEDQGFAAELAVHRQAFKIQVLTGGVAAFRGISCPVIELFPEGRADACACATGAGGQVTYQAARAVAKALSDIQIPAVRQVGPLIGTGIGRVADLVELYNRLGLAQAGLTTEPLVTPSLGVKAVGGESIAVGTNRAALVRRSCAPASRLCRHRQPGRAGRPAV
jgi:hypothetical protein